LILVFALASEYAIRLVIILAFELALE